MFGHFLIGYKFNTLYERSVNKYDDIIYPKKYGSFRPTCQVSCFIYNVGSTEYSDYFDCNGAVCLKHNGYINSKILLSSPKWILTDELLLQLEYKIQRILTGTRFTSNQTSSSVADTHGLNYAFLF
jgi:hypothetical protein